jgi:hypothetical protein
MVAYCVTHHEESCRCTNPSCPPAPEDLQKASELQQKILAKTKNKPAAGAYYDSFNHKGWVTPAQLGWYGNNSNGRVTSAYKTFTNVYTNTVPQFPMYGNHPDTKAPIEISRCSLFKDHATSTSSMTFNCLCGVHGSYQAKAQVTDTQVVNSYQTDIWTIMLKQAFHCPKCDIEHKAAIVKLREEKLKKEQSYLFDDELSAVTNVQAQIAEDLAKTVDSMIMKDVEPP